MIVQKYVKKYWWVLLIIIVMIVVGTYFELLMPECLSMLLEAMEWNESITLAGAVMIIALIISLVISFAEAYAMGYLSSSVSYDMRTDVFSRINSFSEAEKCKFQAGSLITRTLSDIARIQQVFTLMVLAFLKTPIMFAMALIKIFSIELQWTSILVAYSVALTVSIIICMRIVVPKLTELQILMDELTTVSNENISGLCEIRSNNGEEFQHNKFNKWNRKMTDNNDTVNVSLATVNAFIPILINSVTVVIYIAGAYVVGALTDIELQASTINNMIVFSTYAAMVFSAIITLFNSLFYYPQACVAGRRVREVLDTSVSMMDGTFDDENRGDGHIVFENVSFRYPDTNTDVFADVNIEVNPGETLGITGHTGCGKTSLVNLVPRLYDVTAGRVTIDGRDVREYTLKSLHSKIGFVTQSSILLNRSISENVNFGDTSGERTIDDIKNAIRIANASDLVDSHKEKFDYGIRENGTNLSGGQKQRLCIARAICRKPEIYIFDDCFSALDYRTDYLVRKALSEETAGVTKVIVSQRISTIMDADTIIVLSDGKIVGKGKHDKLMEECEEYRRIYESQFPTGVDSER